MRQGTRAALAALTAIAAALALVAPAQATFPGKNGLIAFDRPVGESNYVYTARSNGTRVRRLACSERNTSNQCLDSDPAWSRTGRRLAISNADGIAVVDRDGKLLKQVATEPPPDPSAPELDSNFGRPVWSPSGRAIAFTDSVGDDTEVYIVNVRTGATRKLTHGPAEPAWSSRNRIALASFRLGTIWPDGTKPRTIYNGESLSPDWSPGGKALVFADSDGLLTIRSNGRRRRRVPTGRRAQPQDPKWSPNGKYLIWVDFQRGRALLRALNRKSGRRRSILGNVFNPDWQPRPQRRRRR